MPCSAEAHRVKTGVFSSIFIGILKRKCERYYRKSAKYSPFTTWDQYTDFSYRCVVVTVCAIVFLVGIKCVLLAEKKGWYSEYILFMLGGCVKEGLVICGGFPMSRFATCDGGMASGYVSPCNQDLLMRAGDVESNPGPGSRTDSYRQTRLNSGSSRRISLEKSSEAPPPPPSTPTTSETVSETSLNDLMKMLTSMDTKLIDMDSKFDEVKTDMKELKDSYKKLDCDMENVKQTMQDIRQENSSLKEENAFLKTKLEKLELKMDDLECRSRRNNIILYGINRPETETPKECEDAVQKLIMDKLEFPQKIEFDRVHRISSKSNSPIIGRCTFFKDKEDILKARSKLKGSNVFVSEDFSVRVQEIRRKLSGHLKTARTQGKRATMIYDHLLIDGKKFSLDGNDQLKEFR